MLDILRAKNLYEVVGCDLGDDPNVLAKDVDVVILAVKPQSFKELSESIKIDLSGKLIISIIAGISIQKIKELLKVKKVVRTLPNLALKVGQSLTIWKTDGVSEEEKLLVREILNAFGVEIEVDEENKIEVMGAVSGCGPAYFAFLGEKMAEFCVKNGFTAEQSALIARQTLIGTGEVVKDSGWLLTELRERVSSKGGITEKAIKTLEENDFGGVFHKGVEAAVARTKELNS